MDRKDWAGGAIVGVNGPAEIRYGFSNFFKGLDAAIPQITLGSQLSNYCQNYIHRLENGVKPGETGIKPSFVKPCLDIGREL